MLQAQKDIVSLRQGRRGDLPAFGAVNFVLFKPSMQTRFARLARLRRGELNEIARALAYQL